MDKLGYKISGLHDCINVSICGLMNKAISA